MTKTNATQQKQQVKNQDKKNLIIKTAKACPVDFELLFDAWAVSKEGKKSFLVQAGLDPKSEIVKENTSQWTKKTREAHKQAMKLKAAMPVAQRQIAEMWTLMQNFRKGQAFKDFNAADKLRKHVNIYMDSRLVLDPQTGAIIDTTMEPKEMRQVARTLRDLQAIQRLTLGLPAEHVEFRPADPDTHIEQPEDAENDCPIFIVETTDTGKFKRARPIQVK